LLDGLFFIFTILYLFHIEKITGACFLLAGEFANVSPQDTRAYLTQGLLKVRVEMESKDDLS